MVVVLLAVAIASQAAAAQHERLPARPHGVPSAGPASPRSLDDEWRLAVGPDVAVVSITAERIVLDGHGQTVTLRLAHGPELAPPRVPNGARSAQLLGNAWP
jgi:hypothetical protein